MSRKSTLQRAILSITCQVRRDIIARYTRNNHIVYLSSRPFLITYSREKYKCNLSKVNIFQETERCASIFECSFLQKNPSSNPSTLLVIKNRESHLKNSR